jgi:hypothetical protein
MASVSQIINGLPRPIRLRFDSLGGYVQGVISEDQENLPAPQHLTQQETEMVKLVVFCYAATRFFKEGSEAARSAVDEFKRFEIPGFQVGSTIFEGRNRNVTLGDTLATDLMRAFEGSPLQHFITSAENMTDLVRALARRIRYERRMG